MRLRDLAGIDSDSAGHRLRHRPSQGRARHGLRRFPRHPLQRRGFHSGAAVEAGAVAVVARPGAQVEGAALIAADEPRRGFARLAARFFKPFPATIVAVTGTNGKTSTVELTRQLWRMSGHHAASIGTLGVTTADDQVTTGLTTPDIVTFLSNMAGLAREGVTHAAFEASSHGLSQYRTEGLPVQRRRLHQFQPRSSRLSRHDGGLFRGQDAAVRGSGRSGRRRGDLGRRCQVGRGDRTQPARAA